MIRWVQGQDVSMNAETALEGANDEGEKGDWLVVESSAVDRSSRRRLVLDVEGPDGTPPLLVRWEDNGHEGLVFPGPDAHVAAGRLGS